MSDRDDVVHVPRVRISCPPRNPTTWSWHSSDLHSVLVETCVITRARDRETQGDKLREARSVTKTVNEGEERERKRERERQLLGEIQ